MKEVKADYTHLLDLACGKVDASEPNGRGFVAKQMAKVIARIKDRMQRESFLSEVARRIGISPDVLLEEVRQAEVPERTQAL